MYDGALHSFEFTVTDPSYVAIASSVGNTQVPINFITRRIDASGVRVHVDIYSTSVSGTMPVTMTLLSSRPGGPTCISVVATTVTGPATATSAAAPVTQPYAVQPTHPTTPTVSAIPAPKVQAKAQPVAPNAFSWKAKAPSSTVISGSMQNILKNLCSSDAGAYRTWLILLVLYALVVGGLLWLEFPMSWAWAKTPERVATLILVALVLLLGFWYLVASCRAALWMPLLAFVIAVLGLLAAFWNHPRVTELLLLEQKTQKAAIVTPPPAKK